MHPYQIEAVRHIISHRACALFLDMGLGKTVATLTAVDWLIYEDLDVRRVLVVAPKRVAESVWDEEAAKWSHLKRLRVSKVVGDVRRRKAALMEDADIYVVGRDNVAWLCGLYGGARLPFDMLILDELSSFKNYRSQRFKALRMCVASFRRVVGLTGTPAPNGLIDLWSQIYLLDQGERLGRFISNYRDNWFVPAKRNAEVVFSYSPKAGAAEEIQRRISDICISMKASDFLQLPPCIENTVNIQMPPEVQAEYDRFERDMVLRLADTAERDGVVTATTAAALTNKLQQFANGFVYSDTDGRTVYAVHDLKVDAVKELIEDAQGQPVLIAYNFIEDRSRLIKHLHSYGVRTLSCHKDIDDWNAGRIPVMLMHPASGGHGLNLQAGGSRIIWYGPTWSLELEQQFNARLHRQGQGCPVIINRLICRETIDQDIAAALKAKARTQDALIDAVKARMRKYGVRLPLRYEKS